jgi:RNA polymerase sigma-70 factor (ECF subfamily)
MELSEADIIRSLKERDEMGFERVFRQYFADLHRYAVSIVRDQDLAADIVQNVFYKLWERVEALNFQDSVAAYLYRSVYHASLNSLKHQKVKRAYQIHIERSAKDHTGGPDGTSKKLHMRELEKKLLQAINELPEQCRTIFQMSRFEELRYREIGLRLGISPKTVENQMGKALKLLRTKLVDFFVLALLYLINL